jgi:primosomal protein N' (replication factor Y) (superfamily II helicase)
MSQLSLLPPDDHLLAEEDLAENFYIEVCVNPLFGTFTYLSNILLQVGELVKVPFGRRKIEAFVVSVSDVKPEGLESDLKFKKVIDRVSLNPLFGPADLPFFSWISDFYQVPLAEVLETAIPKITLPKKQDEVVILNSEVLKSFTKKLGPKQIEVIELLRLHQGKLPLSKVSSSLLNSPALLRSLVKKEIVFVEKLQTDKKIVKQELKKANELNCEQEVAYKRISSAVNEGIFKVFLLYGITGSGKTEVYFKAMHEVLLAGKSVLFIVPEIALTPQLFDRLEKNIGAEVAVLHSGVKRSARSKAWQSILSGEVRLVLGARSAVFAPLENIGLVVVDEEHDASYKQSDNLRYNARDLAIVKARIYNCPVILGSATPSLESFYNAKIGRYEILKLLSRYASAQLPKISTIDLNITKPWEMVSSNISQEFYQNVQTALKRKEQVFILYNKRGYAAYNVCKSCGYVETCPHCAVSLTFHSNRNQMVCHYCSYSKDLSHSCGECGSAEVSLKGSGTQKIVEELCALFPESVITRMDRDSINAENSYKDVLDRVRSGEVDILVGTQMLAKGHDLPNVTLVGVVNCDVGLHVPDFRGAEKVFQLLTQVAGRAGRGEKSGKVLLQTRSKNHLSIVKTIKGDFDGFFEEEIINRREKNYPPFTKLLRIIVASKNQHLPMEVLNEMVALGLKLAKDYKGLIQFLGPINAPVSKIKDLWRCHVLIKADSHSILRMLIKTYKRKDAIQSYKRYKKEIRLLFDLDPQDML